MLKKNKYLNGSNFCLSTCFSRRNSGYVGYTSDHKILGELAILKVLVFQIQKLNVAPNAKANRNKTGLIWPTSHETWNSEEVCIDFSCEILGF